LYDLIALRSFRKERSMPYAARLVREVADTPYQSFPPPHIVADSTDPDVIADLGDEIATLSAHIAAATHRLFVLIAEFDRLRGWELDGHSSCAHWLAFRTCIDLGAAREKVRSSRALPELPLTSAAMARGELSFSQVRALTRVAEPGNEKALLELACGSTTAQLERMIRAWKKGQRRDEAEAERERYASRMFSVFPDDDGMYVVRGRLTAEVGVLLMRAIEAASDATYCADEGTTRDAALASCRCGRTPRRAGDGCRIRRCCDFGEFRADGSAQRHACGTLPGRAARRAGNVARR
jgi:hypothetical protein